MLSMPKRMICEADHSLAGTHAVSRTSPLKTLDIMCEKEMGDMPSRMRLAIFCAMAIVFMSACALSIPAAEQAMWTPESVASAITTRSAEAQVASGSQSYKLTVTASCHADEQLVGGGFDASSVFEYALVQSNSYPANNAWTVKANSISHYVLDAYAYCLRGEPSLGTHIVSGETCPAGNIALTHGTADQGIVTLCAARHVTSMSRATAPITLSSRENGYLSQSANAVCPAGALALNGDSTVGMTLASKATDKFAGWEIIAGGEGSGEVYANCFTFA